ncbi:unnamed protein product [Prorocentrum cordatum]|uniref:Uncharacterized protein n=1 Tax=Prorocentrum cordatum TaxID=2364126 RepID=A0ABN9RUE9_9DINO|nr:unnamed protein product [Polarella glacialis]
MVTFCHMRGVRVVVEQPLNSTIYRTAELSEALLMACAKRIITNLGAFGAISVKPIEIWTTLSPHALLPLVRRRTQAFKRLGTYSELCPAKRVKKTQGSKPKKYGWSRSATRTNPKGDSSGQRKGTVSGEDQGKGCTKGSGVDLGSVSGEDQGKGCTKGSGVDLGKDLGSEKGENKGSEKGLERGKGSDDVVGTLPPPTPTDDSGKGSNQASGKGQQKGNAALDKDAGKGNKGGKGGKAPRRGPGSDPAMTLQCSVQAILDNCSRAQATNMLRKSITDYNTMNAEVTSLRARTTTLELQLWMMMKSFYNRDVLNIAQDPPVDARDVARNACNSSPPILEYTRMHADLQGAGDKGGKGGKVKGKYSGKADVVWLADAVACPRAGRAFAAGELVERSACVALLSVTLEGCFLQDYCFELGRPSPRGTAYAAALAELAARCPSCAAAGPAAARRVPLARRRGSAVEAAASRVHGLGVLAARDVAAGEALEVAPVLPVALDGISRSPLREYAIHPPGGDDAPLAAAGVVLLPLGTLGLFNHAAGSSGAGHRGAAIPRAPLAARVRQPRGSGGGLRAPRGLRGRVLGAALAPALGRGPAVAAHRGRIPLLSSPPACPDR